MTGLIKTIAEYPLASLFLALAIYEIVKVITKSIK
ncbi:gp67 [Escherichia phage phiEB49]|uniref:Gp67 n=1 Tax=Escherichia phage phiEB49 TaxID=1048207 RepID=F8UBX7_9CAUD|nr:gp67 [Escherichia phage phiEB49]AEI91267.1 gp67 [Escherichia phage phiEB49]